MTIFLIIIGILVVLCLVMAVMSGLFPSDIKRKNMHEAKKRKNAKQDPWPWWLN